MSIEGSACLVEWFIDRVDQLPPHRAGDFFSKHKDYLSITSNLLEEYTLIVCIGAEKPQGGETVLYLAPSSSHSSKVTGTPGSALLFRKDIEHEGKPIIKGTKEIITLNLWLTKKDKSRVLLVTFPQTTAESESRAPDEPAASSPSGAHELLERAARDDRSYALNIDALLKQHPDSLLAGHVRFLDAQFAPGQVPAKIVTYNCTTATFEDFGLIYRILVGIYVNEKELIEHKQLLEFFGISTHKCLVSIVDEKERNANAPPQTETKSKSKQAKTSKAKSTPAPATPVVNNLAADPTGTVVICSSEERTAVANKLAKELGLNFVTFKILFGEGVMEYGGEMFETPPARVQMLPFWISLGDHDNIFLLRSLVTTGSLEPEPFAQFPKLHDHVATKTKERLEKLIGQQVVLEEVYSRRDEPKIEDTEPEDAAKGVPFDATEIYHRIRYDLAFGLSSGASTGSVVKEVTAGMNFGPKKLIYLPGISDKTKPATSSRLFSYDKDGKTCFTLDQGRSVSERLIAIDLVGKVQERIRSGNLKLVLPQKAAGVDEFFCNENVYGSFNLIMCTGLVLLE